MRNQIRPVSDSDNLIDGIQYSSFATVVGEGTITGGWCGRSRDENPNFNITFSEPVHLLYAVASGVENLYYPTEFSYHYENLSSNRIDYFNLDGENVRFVSFACTVIDYKRHKPGMEIAWMHAYSLPRV